MGLADDLNAYPAADEPEYTPRTEFDGSSGFIQTASFPASEAPDFTAILEQFGYDPTLVRIVGNPRVSRWQQRSRIRGTSDYEEAWLCAYRFHIAPIETTETHDLEALVRQARTRSKQALTENPDNACWFVFQAGDLQLGKRSRDGSTEQIVDRYVQSVEAAKAELKACKRQGIAGVQISLPGDCIEGNQSQRGQNLWLTQETITEQTRILRRLMLFTIDELAPIVNKVYLDTVNGNHDQAQRQQNTYPGDGWATEAAIAVSDALKLNESVYGHVEVRVPEKWSGMMTVPVGDTVVTVVHGHQWRPNGAMKWWSEQALNNQPAGAAHVLQCGHYHSWDVETTEHRTKVQSSTFDCGSDWYREKRGATAKRGGLVYLLQAGEISRMSLV
jgi:predicted phosphodiesterase